MAKGSSWISKMKSILHIGKGKPDSDDDEFGYDGPEGAGDSAVSNDSGIKEFEYRYIASIGGDSYSYKLTFSETPIFTYESMVHPFGEVTMETDAETAAKVAALYETHKLWKWDGFSRSARHVLDGDGFSLSIRFRNGKSMYAHGSNAYPKGYGDFRTDMREVFRPLEAAVIERENRKIIERGVHGKMTSVMANFIQKGQSGSDRYELLLYKPDLREKNLTLQVKSVSGAVFEKGTFSIYDTLPDTPGFFEKVDALIKKYDIMEWYGWDKPAEDYNNAEWFQVHFCYEDGSIGAMGTLHPKNYDAFREELILLMKEAADSIPKSET
ncbi:MAG: hypothetical protein J5757_04055 [Lachnospiraceae bacterium]|nr:hypothetical protein [Lachnospiraceae bacterium]